MHINTFRFKSRILLARYVSDCIVSVKWVLKNAILFNLCLLRLNKLLLNARYDGESVQTSV